VITNPPDTRIKEEKKVYASLPSFADTLSTVIYSIVEFRAGEPSIVSKGEPEI
jgi:hypothetical protein